MKTIKLLEDRIEDLNASKDHAEKAVKHHELMLEREKRVIKNVDAEIKELETDLGILKANK